MKSLGAQWLVSQITRFHKCMTQGMKGILIKLADDTQLGGITSQKTLRSIPEDPERVKCWAETNKTKFNREGGKVPGSLEAPTDTTSPDTELLIITGLNWIRRIQQRPSGLQWRPSAELHSKVVRHHFEGISCNVSGQLHSAKVDKIFSRSNGI